MSDRVKHYIPITSEEAIAIVQAGLTLKAAFGTGGMALVRVEGDPMSPALELVLRLRGITNENCVGAGI